MALTGAALALTPLRTKVPMAIRIMLGCVRNTSQTSDKDLGTGSVSPLQLAKKAPSHRLRVVLPSSIVAVSLGESCAHSGSSIRVSRELTTDSGDETELTLKLPHWPAVGLRGPLISEGRSQPVVLLNPDAGR